ncbi:MAG TPA: hypothetical protein VLW51_00295 [Solirubrobacteraceae bacterium]|nr:hypothetical protein [Solirubrobacteraceae bacterium]
MAAGDLDRLRRRAAEVDAGPAWLGVELGVLDVVVLAVEVDRLAGPQLAHDVEEFAGPGVACPLVEVVAEPALLGVSPPVTTFSSRRSPEMRW